MRSRQVTSEQRYMLAVLRRQGLPQAQMARALGVSVGNISREFA